ncbi:MAG TPA: DUF4238 domain-containing protein [Pyrinomonadaceae bacterium]|nr:DUF4238 domain-containing protein [Pyrinomonadaceae bacterium]
MSDPKRQHWVPRLYLRGFATPDTAGQEDPDVWLFHKEEGDPFRTSISNVAAGSFLYSSRSETGERDFTVEKRLGELENTIAPLWRKFANGFVSLEDPTLRKGIGLFISTLFHRNPQRIDDHLTFLDKLKPQTGTTEAQANPETTELNTTRRKVRKGLTDGFVHTLLSESGPTAEQLIKKRWAVVVAKEPVFATCDNPVMVLHDDSRLRGLGFFGGDILVPVSLTRMMMLDDKHSEGNNYYELYGETLGAFHGITLRYALRFLISSRPSDELLSELVTLSDQLDRGEA